jgi:hypothetical protein
MCPLPNIGNGTSASNNASTSASSSTSAKSGGGATNNTSIGTSASASARGGNGDGEDDGDADSHTAEDSLPKEAVASVALQPSLTKLSDDELMVRLQLSPQALVVYQTLWQEVAGDDDSVDGWLHLEVFSGGADW